MLANGLSLLRVVLAPAVLYGLHEDATTSIDTFTLGLLLAAGLTDVLDGMAARRGGQGSRLGRILDPLADKLFIGSVCVGLVLWREFPVWLLALQVARDLAIIGAGVFLLRSRQLVVGASRLGKAATWAMALTVLAYALGGAAPVRLGFSGVAAALLVISAAGYVRQLTAILRQPPGA